MLPYNLAHLPAGHGIRVTPRKLFGGKRWQVALITQMSAPEETVLADEARRNRREQGRCERCGVPLPEGWDSVRCGYCPRRSPAVRRGTTL